MERLRFVIIVENNKFPVNEWNTFEFNELMIESVGKCAGHPPSDNDCHHDRQHERQIICQLDLQQHTISLSIPQDKLHCLLHAFRIQSADTDEYISLPTTYVF